MPDTQEAKLARVEEQVKFFNQTANELKQEFKDSRDETVKAVRRAVRRDTRELLKQCRAIQDAKCNRKPATPEKAPPAGSPSADIPGAKEIPSVYKLLAYLLGVGMLLGGAIRGFKDDPKPKTPTIAAVEPPRALPTGQ